MPMRHGLTLGEMGHWFIDHFNLDVDYRVIEMEGWRPDAAPGFGWPEDRIWINPSPNAANLNMARAYAGTVMLEGRDLERGQGHDPPAGAVRRARHRAARGHGRNAAPRAAMARRLQLRDIWFQPTFHKHAGQLCNGVHIHAEGAVLRPRHLQAVAAAGSGLQGDPQPLARTTICGATSLTNMCSANWPIDVINGGPLLREWVDDAKAAPGAWRRPTI